MENTTVSDLKFNLSFAGITPETREYISFKTLKDGTVELSVKSSIAYNNPELELTAANLGDFNSIDEANSALDSILGTVSTTDSAQPIDQVFTSSNNKRAFIQATEILGISEKELAGMPLTRTGAGYYTSSRRALELLGYDTNRNDIPTYPFPINGENGLVADTAFITEADNGHRVALTFRSND